MRKGFLRSRVVVGAVQRLPGPGCPGGYMISGGHASESRTRRMTAVRKLVTCH